MKTEILRYTFAASVCMREVEETLLLAVLAVESLFGESTVRLDASYSVDAPRRVCVIDASTEVGRSLSRVFTGFITREFGSDAFCIHRGDSASAAKETVACAPAAC
jgi:hypothetical protein